MTAKPARPVTPIGRVRVGTPVLLAAVVGVAAPVTAAYGAAGGFGRFHDHQQPGTVLLPGPVTAVEVTGLNDSVRVTGSATAAMVTGTSLVEWHEAATQPQLQASVVDGVAILTWTCPGDHCDGGVGWNLTVPAGIPVTVRTSDASLYLDSLTGPVTATSRNGEIEAHHLGSGNATLLTSDAGITAQFDGAPAAVSATTSNADVDIRTDGTPAYDDVRTTNGSTNLTNPGSTTDSTNVDTVPPRADHVIRVRTTNANVTIR